MVRAVVFLILAGLLVLGAVELGPTVMERLGMASPSGESGTADEAFAKLEESLSKEGLKASDLSDAPSQPDEAAPEPRQTYRYFDASGTMHFVDALEKVPEPYRASAKPMGGSELPQLTRAAKTKVHRPAGYGTAIRKIRRDSGAQASSEAQAPAARGRGPGEVVLYSTSWCGWCRKTMAWLDERGIEYENRDIEKNDTWRDELIEKTGKTSIPMVEIDGEVIQGYDPGRMEALL